MLLVTSLATPYWPLSHHRPFPVTYSNIRATCRPTRRPSRAAPSGNTEVLASTAMAPYDRLDDTDRAVLYDSVNSYYAGVVRMALAERDIDFSSYYINMPKQEQLAPWYMRMNPAGMVPALKSAAGEIVNDSRNIVNWAYGSKESAGEKEVLDKLYSEVSGFGDANHLPARRGPPPVASATWRACEH
eukprot:1101577-Prymnesium_polylepis.1